MKRYPDEWDEFIKTADQFLEGLITSGRLVLQPGSNDYIEDYIDVLWSEFIQYKELQRGKISSNLIKDLMLRTDKSISDREILNNRYLGNIWDNHYSYLRGLIINMDINDTLEDLMVKFYDDIGYKYFPYIDKSNIHSIINDQPELTEEFISHVQQYNVFLNVYYLITLEYYIYYLKDLYLNYFNTLQDISIADACDYALFINTELNDGITE